MKHFMCTKKHNHFALNKPHEGFFPALFFPPLLCDFLTCLRLEKWKGPLRSSVDIRGCKHAAQWEGGESRQWRGESELWAASEKSWRQGSSGRDQLSKSVAGYLIESFRAAGKSSPHRGGLNTASGHTQYMWPQVLSGHWLPQRPL